MRQQPVPKDDLLPRLQSKLVFRLFQDSPCQPSLSLQGMVWKHWRWGREECQVPTGSGQNQPLSSWIRTKSPWALELLRPELSCPPFL